MQSLSKYVTCLLIEKGVRMSHGMLCSACSPLSAFLPVGAYIYVNKLLVCFALLGALTVKEFAEACGRVGSAATGRQLLQVQLDLQQKLSGIERSLKTLVRQR